MVTVKPSRFSVLAIDVEEYEQKTNKDKTNRSSITITESKSNAKSSKNNKSSSTPKIGSSKSQVVKPTHGIKKSLHSKSSPNKTQWDDWKKRDTQVVDEKYSNDLKKALLISKKEQEIKKNADDVHENEKVSSKIKKKRTRNRNSMSLDEFQHGKAKTTEIEPVHDHHNMTPITIPEDNDFLNQIKAEAARVIRIEGLQSGLLNDSENGFCNLELNIGSDTRKNKPSGDNKLIQKDVQIQKLNNQIKILEGEISSLKDENKYLVERLSASKVSRNADLLVQVEKMALIRDELTTEISKLIISLEQERSKVRKLQDDLKRAQELISAKRRSE